MRLPKKKDKFEDLPKEFKDAVASMSVEEIDKKIAEVAKSEDENQRLKKEDPDLLEKKELVKEASSRYREATKQNKLKIAFAVQVLKDKGKA